MLLKRPQISEALNDPHFIMLQILWVRITGRTILLLFTALTEITQWDSAGGQLVWRVQYGSTHTSGAWAGVTRRQELPTAVPTCKLVMWLGYLTAWQPWSSHFDFFCQRLWAQVFLLRWKLNCLLWSSLRGLTAVFASHSIGQNSHKPTQPHRFKGRKVIFQLLSEEWQGHTQHRRAGRTGDIIGAISGQYATVSYFTDCFVSV